MAYFQLVSCTVDKTFIRHDESFTATVSVKNISGRNLGASSYWQMYQERAAAEISPATNGRTNGVYNYDGLLIYYDNYGTWNNNATKTFTITMSPTGTGSKAWNAASANIITNLASNRVFQAHLSVSYYVGDDLYDTVFDLPCYYCLEYYAPSLLNLSVVRALADGTTNDEGEKFKTNLSLLVSASHFIDDFTCKVYYKESGTPTTSDYDDVITYDDTTTPSISDLIYPGGVTDSLTFISRTGDFDNGSNWGLLFVFSDGYESASTSLQIQRAFANVHLSGVSTGGVAFGKFSTATLNNPKFECVYPAYFENGIEGLDRYTLTETSSGSGYYTQDVATGGKIYVGGDEYEVHRFTLLDTNTHTVSSAATVATDAVVPITSDDIFMSMTGGFMNTSGEFDPLTRYYSSSSYNSAWVHATYKTIRYRLVSTSLKAFVNIEYAKLV